MRYELGLIIDGVRTVVWEGNEFPPYPIHDMIAKCRRIAELNMPNKRVEMFHECDGKSYSY